jgi:hypothetical protein
VKVSGLVPKEVNMKVFGIRWAKLVGFSFLVLLTAGFLATCKSKEAKELKPVEEQEVVTLEALKPVLGEAKENVSGVVDVTGDAQELIISYRYYDEDQQNYDDDMVKEMAPKIQALYKEFSIVDRVVFQISSNNPLMAGDWRPYVSFVLTRKIVEEIQWSELMTEEFLKRVIEFKRLD